MLGLQRKTFVDCCKEFCHLNKTKISKSKLICSILRLRPINKKLSYCCGSRSYCMQLALFIVIATSQLLNKKIRLLSVRRSNNYCGLRICVRNPQSAHLCLTGSRAVNGVSLLTNEPCLFDSQPESHRHLWRFSLRFFCGAFCG